MILDLVTEMKKNIVMLNLQHPSKRGNKWNSMHQCKKVFCGLKHLVSFLVLVIHSQILKNDLILNLTLGNRSQT